MSFQREPQVLSAQARTLLTYTDPLAERKRWTPLVSGGKLSDKLFEIASFKNVTRRSILGSSCQERRRGDERKTINMQTLPVLLQMLRSWQPKTLTSKIHKKKSAFMRSAGKTNMDSCSNVFVLTGPLTQLLSCWQYMWWHQSIPLGYLKYS